MLGPSARLLPRVALIDDAQAGTTATASVSWYSSNAETKKNVQSAALLSPPTFVLNTAVR